MYVEIVQIKVKITTKYKNQLLNILQRIAARVARTLPERSYANRVKSSKTRVILTCKGVTMFGTDCQLLMVPVPERDRGDSGGDSAVRI